MEYNIRIEFDAIADADAGDRLMAALEHVHPAPSRSDLGRLEVTITLLAENVRQAALLAFDQVRSIEFTVVALEVLRTEDFDRLAGIVPMPELINAEQAAAILKVSKQAVSKQFHGGKIPGQLVGDRNLIFAARDIIAIASKRPGYSADLGLTYSGAMPASEASV